MLEKNFQGIFPFLVTPLHKDGTVNESVLRKLVKHLIQSGVHGLTPLGSTGEITYLNRKQRYQVIKTVVDEVNGRLPVVAGVGAMSTREAVSQSKAIEQLGIDGILAILPTYFPVSRETTIQYFQRMAKAVSCPIVLYTNPRFSKADLTPDMLNELVEVPNIKYLKDASGDIGKLISIVNQIEERIHIFSSSAHVPVFVFMLGGVGWMAGPACLIPKQCVRLFKLCQAKDWEKALSLQTMFWKLLQAFQKYSLAACIKAGLEIQGFPVGEPLHPQKRLNEQARREVHQILARWE